MKYFSKWLGVCAAMGIAVGVSAEVKVDDCFGDNMVLQRELPARIRGTANPGERVTVKFAGQTVEATADAKGDWIAKLQPLQASSEPAELTVSGPDNTVTLKNILVGEVWLCTGQSNMQYALFSRNPNYLHTDSEAITSQANYPQIRIAVVPLRFSTKFERASRMKWQAVTPDSVKSFSAVGYLFGLALYRELGVPVGLIRSCWGGTRIEPWTTREGFESVPEGRGLADFVAARTGGTEKYRETAQKFLADQRNWLKRVEAAVNKEQIPPPAPAVPAEFGLTDRSTPGALYNAMIHPLTGMTVRGAIWYQGEANLNQWYDYRWQMHALVNGWKLAFDNPAFQFHFVQIAPYRYNRDLPRTCPGLWMAQQQFADESGCGMAVINDHGDPEDIHPHDKRPVGDRLARLALNHTYGKKEVVCDAPRVGEFKVYGGKFVVNFKNASSLSTADGGEVKGLEVAGIDGKFVPAQAQIRGAALEASSPQVAQPRYLRYLWSNTAMGNLRNEHGLVPAPFKIGSVSREDELAYLKSRPGLIYEYDLFSGTVNGVMKPVVNRAKEYAGKELERLYYLFVLKDKSGKTVFADVSLAPFTQDLRIVGVPGSVVRRNVASPVSDLRVRGNVPVLVDGEESRTGNIEFFYTSYGPRNIKGIRSANDKIFDAGDQPSGSADPGYGCLQFHRGNGTPVVCFNRFSGKRGADLGFGRCGGKNPDWTFSKGGLNYTSARLYVFGDFK